FEIFESPPSGNAGLLQKIQGPLERLARRIPDQTTVTRKKGGFGRQKNMKLSDILGWTATFLFTICYIPQMIKTSKSGPIDGLSFRLLLVSFIANIVALCYATLIHQPPLQIKYSLAMVFLSGCMYFYLKVYFRMEKIKDRR